MKNPWEDIDIQDYENHMSSESVMQLQGLSDITKHQLNDQDCESVCFFGIAGGNGLEHVNKDKYTKVFCIDVNSEYLKVCKKRYSSLGDTLCIIQLDLADINALIPKSELIIANLIIEYIGIESFVEQIKKADPKYVSCVIQNKSADSFISKSGYEEVMYKLDSIHTLVNADELIAKIAESEYECTNQNEITLPNGKSFTKLDFIEPN